MKYTVSSQKAMSNIIHSLKEIEQHLAYKRKNGEGYDENYLQLSRIKDEMYRQLGEWYFIQQTI